MRGFLTFLVLRLISKKNISGEEITKEIEKRKGSRPSPGTIYPVLKYLKENGLIHEIKDTGKSKRYTVTKKGEHELKISTKRFISIFCDMKEEF